MVLRFCLLFMLFDFRICMIKFKERAKKYNIGEAEINLKYKYLINNGLFHRKEFLDALVRGFR